MNTRTLGTDGDANKGSTFCTPDLDRLADDHAADMQEALMVPVEKVSTVLGMLGLIRSEEVSGIRRRNDHRRQRGHIPSPCQSHLLHRAVLEQHPGEEGSLSGIRVALQRTPVRVAGHVVALVLGVVSVVPVVRRVTQFTSRAATDVELCDVRCQVRELVLKLGHHLREERHSEVNRPSRGILDG